MAISVFNSTSKKIEQNYRKNTGYSFSKGEAGEAKAYTNVRNLILSHLGVDPSKVDDFRFSFRSQTASFTDPVSGDLQSVNLPGIKDQNIQKALEKYYNISGAKKWLSGAHVIANSKGDEGGTAPLQRNTKALTNLPKEIKNQDVRIGKKLLALDTPQQRNEMARRFIFFNHFRSEWLKKIKEKIETREQAIKSPTLSDKQMLRLKKELQDLKHLQSEIESIDLFAMQHVLESFPVEKVNQATLDEMAEEVKKRVLASIKPRQWMGMRAASHSQKDHEYASDVAGMLYLDRHSYYKFCQNQKIKRKREGVADLFLREAIQFAKSPEGKYTPEGFEDSCHLNSMNDDLKKELQDDLHAVGVLSSYGIPHQDPKEYDRATMPANLSEKEQKEFYNSQLEVMQKAFKTHKDSIKTNLQLANIPPPPVEEPGVRSLIRTTGGLLAGGAAVVGAGLATGLLEPATAYNLAQYIQNHPARMIATVSLLDTLRHKAVNYIAPIERNPNTGRIEKHVNYKRLAIVSGSALAMIMMGTAMYNAVNDGEETGGYVEQAASYVAVPLVAAAQAINYVWNNPSLQLPINPITVPGTNLTWQRTLPTAFVIHAAGALNRLPVIGAVIQPIHRAVKNVAIAAQIIPAAKWSYEKGKRGYEIGSEYASEGYKRAVRALRRKGRFAKEFGYALKDYLGSIPVIHALAVAICSMSKKKAPLSLM